jgi:mono/diheme cytochrome c family protein
MRKAPRLASDFLTTFLSLFLPAATATADELVFERDVRPIFKAACFQCHGEADTCEGGLDVRLTRLVLHGGDSGPAIVAGNAAESLLYQRVRDGEMPEGTKKLSPQQIETIGRWIDEGAKTARLEPDDPNQVQFTAEELTYWAFQPIARFEPPTAPPGTPIRTPIDAFVWQGLQAEGLKFSPEADRVALIRRAYFDLWGLPPSPEDVAQFVDDQAPNAYERLIDRLLDSPRYGERWGRHWLDAAGFAESDGVTPEDRVRDFAYKYRDYVIRAINADKPWNEFIIEQLAGDELAARPYATLQGDALDPLIATGFLRMAPDGTDSDEVDQTVERNQVVAETLKIVGNSMLGLTVGCAQCHDHRYDPISQVDYYRLRAVFDPALDWQHWRTPSARLVDVTPEENRQKSAEIEAQAVEMDRAIEQRLDALFIQFKQAELERVPEERRKTVRAAAETSRDQRTPEQVALLQEFPTADVNRGSLEGLLVEYDRVYQSKYHQELQASRQKVADVRAQKPLNDYVMALTETDEPLSESKLFARGDPLQPREAVTPGELAILALARESADIAAKSPALSSSGRRLAFGRMLTDGRHPLTPRVLVNRFWMHHFGRGIVATPGDFGALGERPSHPELLDWLASEFVANGWQLKPLHRLIMTSTAYRQSSARIAASEQLDPDNRLLSRYPFRRLEAEAIRDAILTVTGKLNLRMYGPSVPVVEDTDGQVVVGKRAAGSGGSLFNAVDAAGDEQFRRSVYLQVRRKWPLALLESFDMPQMSPCCDTRKASTVTPQALLFMNSAFLLEQSRALAERVAEECPADSEAQVRRVWLLAYQVDISPETLAAAREYLHAQTETFTQYMASLPEAERGQFNCAQQALASYCHAVLSSNRFLYIE